MTDYNKRLSILLLMDEIFEKDWLDISNKRKKLDLEILYLIQTCNILQKKDNNGDPFFIRPGKNIKIIDTKVHFKGLSVIGISTFINAFEMRVFFKYEGKKNFSTHAFPFNPLLYTLFTTEKTLSPEILEYILSEIRECGYRLYNFQDPYQAIELVGKALDYRNESEEFRLWFKLQ